jgi:DNA mismatch endonuclease (patch repair protein)
MVDKLSRYDRSRNMAAIRGRNTKPELAVRRILSDLGVRYRLYVRSLPGRPDVVMRSRGKIIEIRGCFWHRHKGCRFAYMPKSHVRFWKHKFDGNLRRDRRNDAKLKSLGFNLLVVWECRTKDLDGLRKQLKNFIGRK